MFWKISVLLLVLLPGVFANQIDFNRAIFDVEEDNVHLTNTIDFHLEDDIGLEINLPTNFDNLIVKSGGDELDYIFRNGKVVVGIGKNTNQIIVEYDTKDYINENSFVVDFSSPLDSKFVFLEVWLDEEYAVEKISPEAKEVRKEDGRVKVIWRFEDLKENKRIVLLFNEKSNLGYFVMPVFALIIIIYLIISRRKV